MAKQRYLRHMKDQQKFSLSKSSKVIYEMVRKERGRVWGVFTSTSSGKSYKRLLETTKVFIP